MTKTRVIVALGLAALLSFTMAAAATSGYIPIGLSVYGDDIGPYPVGAEIPACPVQKDGSPASLADYKAYMNEGGFAYLAINAAEFMKDKDAINVFGPLPDFAQGYTFAMLDPDPAKNPDFTTAVIWLYGDDGCVLNHMEVSIEQAKAFVTPDA